MGNDPLDRSISAGLGSGVSWVLDPPGFGGLVATWPRGEAARKPRVVRGGGAALLGRTRARQVAVLESISGIGRTSADIGIDPARWPWSVSVGPLDDRRNCVRLSIKAPRPLRSRISPISNGENIVRRFGPCAASGLENWRGRAFASWCGGRDRSNGCRIPGEERETSRSEGVARCRLGSRSSRSGAHVCGAVVFGCKACATQPIACWFPA